MTLIGKMQRRLERDASNKTAERVNDEIEASGKDGLELAARVCSVAYKGVKERLPANREYRTGYAMALAELAVVLRGMRRGEHPRADEMAEARRGVVELIEAEFDGPTGETLVEVPDLKPETIAEAIAECSKIEATAVCSRCEGTGRIRSTGFAPLSFPCPECAS